MRMAGCIFWVHEVAQRRTSINFLFLTSKVYQVYGTATELVILIGLSLQLLFT